MPTVYVRLPAQLFASVATTVNVVPPVAVGVPLMTPALLNVKPAGKALTVTANV